MSADAGAADPIAHSRGPDSAANPREKGTPYHDLGLNDLCLSDKALLDAIETHPILINRPLVVTPKGVRLCRPSQTVLDLPPAQRGRFLKEDGERVVDDHGRRIATT